MDGSPAERAPRSGTPRSWKAYRFWVLLHERSQYEYVCDLHEHEYEYEYEYACELREYECEYEYACI